MKYGLLFGLTEIAFFTFIIQEVDSNCGMISNSTDSNAPCSNKLVETESSCMTLMMRLIEEQESWKQKKQSTLKDDIKQ